MTRTRTPIRDIIVVDPQPDDYAPLLASRALPDATFHFATTAEAALRIPLHGDWLGLRSPRSKRCLSPSRLWLVNLQLPDLPGLDLCEQLRDRDPHVVALLVCDEHDPFAELESRSRWPMPFVCKPAQPEWLTQCSRFAGYPLGGDGNITRSAMTTFT